MCCIKSYSSVAKIKIPTLARARVCVCVYIYTHTLVHRREKCVEIKGDYVEKQQSCVISVTLKSWSGRKHLDPTTYIPQFTWTPIDPSYFFFARFFAVQKVAQNIKYRFAQDPRHLFRIFSCGKLSTKSEKSTLCFLAVWNFVKRSSFITKFVSANKEQENGLANVCILKLDLNSFYYLQLPFISSK